MISGPTITDFAFANPASYYILGRLYPADQRATVNGMYASGLYFGGGLADSAGGPPHNQLVNDVIFLDLAAASSG